MDTKINRNFSNELTKEKLIHLLEHWIAHNESHSKSFNEWILKLNNAGFTAIVILILID